MAAESSPKSEGGLEVWLPNFMPINNGSTTKSLLLQRPPSVAESTSSVASNEEKSGNPRYKTEICRNFKERSRCIYGDRCQFAHGRRELRDVVRNAKYKTKLCQKYWMSGYCAYGPRCNFLHEEATPEEKANLQKEMEKEQDLESPTRDRSPINLVDVDSLDGLASYNNDMTPDLLMEAWVDAWSRTSFDD